jgi:hypothetical protein
MHIQCDDELLINHLNPVTESEGSAVQDSHSMILGNWHAATVHALGSRFLLYVHTKSLYSTLDLMDNRNAAFMPQTVQNLRGKILEMLSDYYTLTDYQENGIIQPFKHITFGPLNDPNMKRITQGIIVAYQKRFLRARRASLDGQIRLWELEDDLNNVPRRNLGGSTPAQILRQLVWSGIN